jgi:hypothetical protein
MAAVTATATQHPVPGHRSPADLQGADMPMIALSDTHCTLCHPTRQQHNTSLAHPKKQQTQAGQTLRYPTGMIAACKGSTDSATYMHT